MGRQRTRREGASLTLPIRSNLGEHGGPGYYGEGLKLSCCGDPGLDAVSPLPANCTEEQIIFIKIVQDEEVLTCFSAAIFFKSISEILGFWILAAQYLLEACP